MKTIIKLVYFNISEAIFFVQVFQLFTIRGEGRGGSYWSIFYFSQKDNESKGPVRDIAETKNMGAPMGKREPSCYNIIHDT